MQVTQKPNNQYRMLSVVVPVCNEEPNITSFCQRMKHVLEKIHLEWEVIFVEDSSTDKTAEVIRSICLADKRFCAIFLTRSFGHHQAFTAGIDHARGDHIIMMDVDLQHPPEFIPRLMETYFQGFDMVYAKRSTKQPFTKHIGSKLINKFTNLLSDYPIDLNSSIFRIFSRQVADVFISMREHNRFITGMLSWPGFKTKELFFEEEPRKSGKTKYSFKRMVRLALDAVISFSIKPLRVSIFLGFICSAVSFLIGIFHILQYLVAGIPVAGFTSIIVAIFFIGGLILLVLGVIGEYIGNIFIELKNRPLYVVSETLNILRRNL